MNYVVLALCLAVSASSWGQTKTTVKKATKTTQPAKANEISSSKPIEALSNQPLVYNYVEQMPQPTIDMADYLSKNIHYPDSAKNNNIQGRVIVRFIVNEDGSASNFDVVRSLGYGCDEESVRVLKHMPAWTPAKQGGKTVKVYYTQPISFLLH